MEFEIRFTFNSEEARSAVEEILGSMVPDWKLPNLDRVTKKAVDALNSGGSTSRKWVLGEILAATIAAEGGIDPETIGREP